MATEFTPAGDTRTEFTELDDLDASGLLTVAEVAELMRVSTRTVQRWVASGDLKAFKAGGTLRIQRWDLLQLKSSPRKAAAR